MPVLCSLLSLANRKAPLTLVIWPMSCPPPRARIQRVLGSWPRLTPVLPRMMRLSSMARSIARCKPIASITQSPLVDHTGTRLLPQVVNSPPMPMHWRDCSKLVCWHYNGHISTSRQNWVGDYGPQPSATYLPDHLPAPSSITPSENGPKTIKWPANGIGAYHHWEAYWIKPQWHRDHVPPFSLKCNRHNSPSPLRSPLTKHMKDLPSLPTTHINGLCPYQSHH